MVLVCKRAQPPNPLAEKGGGQCSNAFQLISTAALVFGVWRAQVGHMISQEVGLVVAGLGFKRTLGGGGSSSSSSSSSADDDEEEEEEEAGKKNAQKKTTKKEEDASVEDSDWNEIEESGSGDADAVVDEEEDEEEDVKGGNERMLCRSPKWVIT